MDEYSMENNKRMLNMLTFLKLSERTPAASTELLSGISNIFILFSFAMTANSVPFLLKQMRGFSFETEKIRNAI